MNLMLLVCALYLTESVSALPIVRDVSAEAEELLRRDKRQANARNWTVSGFSEVSL